MEKRHNVLKETWSAIIKRAGLAPRLEPLMRQFVPGGIEENQPFFRRKGDILFYMDGSVEKHQW